MDAQAAPAAIFPAPIQAVKPKQPLYFINAPVDIALIGGLSILAFLFVHFYYGSHDPRLDPGVRNATDPVVVLGQRLLWICNWPHFAATNYRLYHSRENIRQYPLTALVIPWLVMAGVFGSVLYPDSIAPYFVLIFMLWSPYHFSGQTVGISLIYARRSGFSVGKLERLALSTFVFGTFLSTTINSHVSGNLTLPSYFGIPVNSLGLPAWMFVVSETTMYFAGIVLALCMIRWCIQNKRVLPLIVLLPAVAQYVWFVASNGWPSFVEFVPFFHSMQYLLIAWSMQLKEKLDLEQAKPSQPRTQLGWAAWGVATCCCAVAVILNIPAHAEYRPAIVALVVFAFTIYGFASVRLQALGARPSRRYVFLETLRWWETNIFCGAALFYFFPMALTRIWGVKEMLALGVTAAAVQIHHFFVDGVIWKLKRKTVSSPLMVNIDDLIHPAPAAMPVIAGIPSMTLPQSVEQKV
jgi:hypothetical protein